MSPGTEGSGGWSLTVLVSAVGSEMLQRSQGHAVLCSLS